jgi:hypothetical protein
MKSGNRRARMRSSTWLYTGKEPGLHPFQYNINIAFNPANEERASLIKALTVGKRMKKGPHPLERYGAGLFASAFMAMGAAP